jgi:rRNA processing protein Krr1/Pno1
LTENATRGPGPDTDETKALTLLEEYTFLPQISVEAFVTPDINISNVRLFLDAIKPVTKTYLFQVIIGEFQDEVEYLDRLGQHLRMDVTPSIDFNETNTQPQSVLDGHEITPVLGLSVDTEGALIQEELYIEVASFGVPIASFLA